MQTDALSAASLLSPSPISGVEWDLSLVGKNITLDDELYANLPKQVSEIFRYIQPYGTVDVRYEYRSPQGSILPGAPAAFRTPSHRALWVDSVGDGIRIALPAMSYNLDRFRGSFQYNNGNFSLTDFSAVHGSTKFSGKAEGSVDSVNQWSVHLNRILIDNLQFDHDLMTAIPEEARIVIAAKRPEGALYYDGRMDIHYDNQTSKPFSLDWKGEIGIVGGSLDLGFPLNAINGGIEICGHWTKTLSVRRRSWKSNRFFTQNLQFTNICGPIWIDNQQLLRVVRRKKTPARPAELHSSKRQSQCDPCTQRQIHRRRHLRNLRFEVRISVRFSESHRFDERKARKLRDSYRKRRTKSKNVRYSDAFRHRFVAPFTARKKENFTLQTSNIYKTSVMMCC